MNRYTCSLFALIILLSIRVAAQEVTTRDPAATEVLKADLPGLPFPYFRSYAYTDKKGSYNLVLCEKQAGIEGTDTLRSKISAICFLQDHGGCLEKWRISDAIDPAVDKEYGTESSIWFWTKYCSASDLDGDGITEPVIVYGTKSEYGFKRVKIITVYKGKKYAIRAVECDLDHCRTFTKDAAFKELPVKVRQYIDQLLERMRKEQGLILQNH